MQEDEIIHDIITCRHMSPKMFSLDTPEDLTQIMHTNLNAECLMMYVKAYPQTTILDKPVGSNNDDTYIMHQILDYELGNSTIISDLVELSGIKVVLVPYGRTTSISVLHRLTFPVNDIYMESLCRIVQRG